MTRATTGAHPMRPQARRAEALTMTQAANASSPARELDMEQLREVAGGASQHTGAVNVCFADGSVRFLR